MDEDHCLYRSLVSLLREHLPQDRLLCIYEALQRSPKVSTLRINTLQMSDSDGLSMLLLSDDGFTINQSKDIPELIRIEDAAKGACDVHPVGLEVQVSLAAAKAFLRGADIYAVHCTRRFFFISRPV